MEFVSRKRKWKATRSGTFFQLTAEFVPGQKNVYFSLPSGYVGALTREGGLISLVDLRFCQRDGCQHFRPDLSDRLDLPTQPPPRPATVKRRLPPAVPDDVEVLEPQVLFDSLPLPSDPAKTTSLARPRRSPQEEETEDALTYTVGYRRETSKSAITFGEDDSLDGLARKLSTYHFKKMGEAYSDLLSPTPKLEIIPSVVSRVIGKTTRTMNVAKVRVTLPPLFRVAVTEKFALEIIGFRPNQIAEFSVDELPGEPLYGFVNNTGAPQTYAAEKEYVPSHTARQIMASTPAIAGRFKRRPSDHTKSCTLQVVSQAFTSSYSRTIAVPPADANEPVPVFVQSLFNTILQDVTSEMKLSRGALTAQLAPQALWLRPRNPLGAAADLAYPNLTLHFKTSSRTSKRLGLYSFDFRWDGMTDYKVAEFPADSSAGNGSFDTPGAERRLSRTLSESPKKTRSRLLDDDLLAAATTENETSTLQMFLANPEPLDLDRLEEEKRLAEAQEQSEGIIRTVRVLKEEEARVAEERRKTAEEDREARRKERERLAQVDRIKKQEEAEAERVRQEKAAERARLQEQDRLKKLEAEKRLETERKQREEEAAAAETRRREEEEAAAETRRREEEEAAAAPPRVPTPPHIIVMDPPSPPPTDEMDVPNPEPVKLGYYTAAIDEAFRGHADFNPEPPNNSLVPPDYTVVFEEGSRTDYIAGVGPCCVLAYVRENQPLDNKYTCEYPPNWDGGITLSLYNNHQASITPTRNCLALLSVQVCHSAEK